MDKISGIYKITNKETGKFYIGSSNNIYKRWDCHKRQLNDGTHINKYLQLSWNKHGEDVFAFEVLEECEEKDLLKVEQKYIDKYFNSGNMYNICSNASAPMTNRKHSPDTLEKLSKSHKGLMSGEKNPMYGKHLSDETKKKLSERFSGVNNPFYGRKLSDESKAKISKANSGRVVSAERKEYLSRTMSGENNPFYGKKHTKESLALMSKNRKGLLMGLESPVSRQVVRIPENNEPIKIFDTVTEAAIASNAQRSHIALVCNGKRKHAGGYKWKYLEDYQQANTEVTNQIAKG